MNVVKHFDQGTQFNPQFNLQKAIDDLAARDIDDSPELQQVHAPSTVVPENQEHERIETTAFPLSSTHHIFSSLTPRARQVAKLLVTGFTTDFDIATAMGVVPGSIRKLMTELFDITGTYNRVELALYIVRHPELEAALQNVTIVLSQKRGRKK